MTKRGMGISSREYVERRQKEGAIPYIRISDLVDGSISSQEIKHISKSDIPRNATVRKNDVLFSIAGTIGKTAIVPERLDGAVASSQVVILRPIERTVSAEFLMMALSSKYVREQVRSLETGAFIRHLGLKGLRNLRLIVPPLAEQRRLVRRMLQLKDEYRDSKARQERVAQELEKLLEDL